MATFHATLKDRNGAVTTGKVGGKDRAEAQKMARFAFPGRTVVSLVEMRPVAKVEPKA